MNNNTNLFSELETEDVYDILQVFESEAQAEKYLSEYEGLDHETFRKKLVEGFVDGVDRLHSIQIKDDVYLQELNDGRYVLWESY